MSIRSLNPPMDRDDEETTGLAQREDVQNNIKCVMAISTTGVFAMNAPGQTQTNATSSNKSNAHK
jgi:hypothetical protein